MYTLYRVIFATYHFQPSTPANGFTQFYIYPDTAVLRERLKWATGFAQSLNSSTDDESENKMCAKISLYTVICNIQCKHDTDNQKLVLQAKSLTP